eukprot:gene6534-16303_t
MVFGGGGRGSLTPGETIFYDPPAARPRGAGSRRFLRVDRGGGWGRAAIRRTSGTEQRSYAR